MPGRARRQRHALAACVLALTVPIAGAVDPAPVEGETFPACTQSYRATPGATPKQKLDAAIAAATAERCFIPPPYPYGLGPTEPQGVVHVEFDPASPEWESGNFLEIEAPLQMRSHVRIAIDSGIVLRYLYWNDGALFNLHGRDHVTLTRGDASRGSGRRTGRFVIDATGGPSDSTTPMRSRLVWLHDTDRFLVEQFHTIQSLRTNAAAVVFNGEPGSDATSPRNGIYRHHSNENSPQGYGPNQITSLWNAYIHDLWSDGGTTLRLETDGNHSGVHDVIVDEIYGQNGNRVVVLMPYAESSETISITNVRGIAMYEGILLGDHTGGGVFTDVSISGGCIVSGDTAQAQVPTGQYPDPVPRQRSRTVVQDSADPAGSISVAAIGYDESIAFLDGDVLNPPADHPGVDPGLPCDAAIAQSGPPFGAPLPRVFADGFEATGLARRR